MKSKGSYAILLAPSILLSNSLGIFKFNMMEIREIGLQYSSLQISEMGHRG